LIPDVMVGLWLALSYYFFCARLDEETPSRPTCWGFAAACALNVLTKGLIGLAFPIGTIGLYLLLSAEFAASGEAADCFQHRGCSLCWPRRGHLLAAIRNPAQGQARDFCGFISSTNTSCAS